jgi:hypothetical protein
MSEVANATGPRAVRLEAPKDFVVSVRTLGTRTGYEVPVCNISKSGLLLEWRNAKTPLPFLQNTLVEMEMKTVHKGKLLTINCMGKVVRHLAENGAAMYGVRMINTEDGEMSEWLNLISKFEKSLPQV